MPAGRRLGDYLASRRNLVGSGLALLAVVLLLLDPVGPVGLLLVVGFYLLGVAAARSKPAIDRFGFDPRVLEKALQEEIAEVSGRVPVPLIRRLQRIELILRTQILPRLECFPPGSLDLYLVERTARDYVPTAMANYLRLPSDDSIATATALQITTDELALLEAEMRRIAAQVRRADMDRLLAHQRFLNERFRQVDASG